MGLECCLEVTGAQFQMPSAIGAVLCSLLTSQALPSLLKGRQTMAFLHFCCITWNPTHVMWLSHGCSTPGHLKTRQTEGHFWACLMFKVWQPSLTVPQKDLLQAAYHFLQKFCFQCGDLHFRFVNCLSMVFICGFFKIYIYKVQERG